MRPIHRVFLHFRLLILILLVACQPAEGANTVPNLNITYLKMFDAKHGWALLDSGLKEQQKEYIVNTSDGGNTWHNVTPSQWSSGFPFNSSLEASDAQTAWAFPSGNETGKIWRTIDGGQTWDASKPIAFGLQYYAPFLHFVNSKDGWLMAQLLPINSESYNVWFQTADGGLNWQPVGWSQSLVCDLQSEATCQYRFTAEKIGFGGYTSFSDLPLSKVQGAPAWEVKRTINGGASWTSIRLTIPPDLIESFGQNLDSPDTYDVTRDLTSFGPNLIEVKIDVWLQGSGMHKDYRYFSADQGNSWHSFSVAEGSEPFFLNAENGWRFFETNGSYSLDRTIDSGATWETVAANLPWRGQLLFVDEKNGWATLWSNKNWHLAHTTDGGHTWMILNPVVVQ